jgi:endonuclease/exonuclease/phosphatase family metal-dependent hydrolase
VTSAGKAGRDGGARDRDLSILHWNVHSWRDASGRPNLDAVIGLVTRHNPDVVSLVEVDEPWAAPNSVSALARRTGYSWIFIPAVEQGRAGRGQAEPGGAEPGGAEPGGAERGRAGPGGAGAGRGYGNALLTRRPVLAVQQWRLTWPATVYNGTERSEARTVVLARVQAGAGTAVWVGSTHLPSGDAGARAAALEQLTAAAAELDRPWVICGDFNTGPRTWIKPGQPVVVAPRPAWPTFPARFPVKALDYCIASPGVRLRARPLLASGSDHLPLLARCRFTGPQTTGPQTTGPQTAEPQPPAP